MKPIDNCKEWLDKINSVASADMLTDDEIVQWKSISKSEKEQFLTELIKKPIVFDNPEIIYNWYFRNKWAGALELTNQSTAISVFEVGAGGCDIVPKAMSKKFPHSDTRYVTANLNKELTQIFKWKTEKDPIQISVIEDDASNIKSYVGEGVFDAVVFEHSVNDVLETILAEQNGIDTVNHGWMEILPSITEIVNKEWNNGTFEENTKCAFLNLISRCLEVLRTGGFLIFAHYQFQYNLDIGLSPELNQSIIPMVRKWFLEHSIGKEVLFDGFDPNWWLFIKK